MGEVGFVPGSHDGPLYDLYDGDVVGRCARATTTSTRPGSNAAEYPVGPGRHDHGAQLPHGARVGAQPLRPGAPAAAPDVRRRRRVLVHRPRAPSPHGEELIRGEPARWARHDPRPCLMPPTGPYRPIFAVQQREAPSAS